MDSNFSCLSFLLFFFLFFKFCHAISSLTAGQKLRLNETIVSEKKVFELGFFVPNGSSFQNRYLGIWYYGMTSQTIVWVANRESPIPKNDSGAVLDLSGDGNLALLDRNGRAIWSTGGSSVSAPDTRMTLMDTGNLVITQPINGYRLWESFRHPTDTFLPDMLFIRNITSGESLMWRSWKSAVDPSPGPFSLGLDRNSSQLYLSNGTVTIWRTGPLKGRTFTGVADMSEFDIFGFNPSTQGDEYYIAFAQSDAGLMRFVLDYTGQITDYIWNSSTRSWSNYWVQFASPCDLYDRCGEFSVCNPVNSRECGCLPGFEPSSSGCSRRIPIVCGNNSGRDGSASGSSGFKIMPKMKPPDHAILNQSVASVDECRQSCLKVCPCTAFAYESDMGCLLWNGALLDLQQFSQDGDGVELNLRLDSSELGSNRHSATVIYATTITSAAILCAIGFFLWRCSAILKGFWKGKVSHGRLRLESCGSPHFGAINPKQGGEEESPGLPLFDFNTIRAATDDFSDAYKLGEGGFGPVYKGVLPEGREIAVKRLSRSSGQGLQEFMNEVKLIAKLQHRNLVRLLGCCIEKQEKILIYEYMPNKSLDAFLFDPAVSPKLDWEKRFGIVMGIARGLLYLHQDSRLKVVHRDLKASNILLDATLNPKISDFGIARIFGADQTQENTRRVVGTYGYMSPEYAIEGRYSIRSDVFSFGVLVLEIVSGKRVTRFHHEELLLNLLGYSWKLWKEGKALELLDPSLRAQCCPAQVLRCINVGLLCVQDEAADRPVMSTVIQMLGSDAANFYEPQMPAYFRRRRLLDDYSSSTDGDPRGHTLDDLTISTVGPR